MADNKIRFGVSNARYALVTETGYGEWKRIPGAVNIQIEPQETQTDFYADNKVYFTQAGAASDQVTIEIADLGDTGKIDLLGYKRVGGGLALPVNSDRKEFVLGFQVEGDITPLRVNIFGGKLNRPSNTYSTKNETVEPSTMSIEGRFNGATFTVDGEEEAYLYHTAQQGDDAFATWWDEVKTPGDIASGGTDPDETDPDNP